MDKLRKMLRMIAKGKCPEAADLGMGREEFVQLVSHALDNGYIEENRTAFLGLTEIPSAGNISL